MASRPEIDPDIPLNPNGVVYHIEANSSDIADRIILVGDPGRVPWAATFFDPGSIRFEHQHREIRTMTGTYKGIPVTCLSTGMGTDNIEIILNELQILKEYNAQTGHWGERSQLTLIRVGTCGSPQDIPLGSLAITQQAIGLDNTCQYYTTSNNPEISDLARRANQTPLGQVGLYATKAHPEITAALAHSAKTHAQNRRHLIGTTASASGFYACQGRAVGRLKPHMRFPNLINILAELDVLNLEMENSTLCFLSHLLGWRAGTICAVVSTRNKERRAFATPEQIKGALHDALVTALEAITE
jgi:uridine phosphorylase